MFKYRTEIFDGIVNSLIKKQVEVMGLTYSKLYLKLVSHLGHGLSHRDYNSHLVKMKEENIIYSQKIKGKKKSEYYCLTKIANKLYRLKILGIGKEYERRLSLYHLIIYFEAYKRGQILTSAQLHKFLKRIGISWDKLRKIDTTHLNAELSIQAAYEEPVTEIEILELTPSKFEIKTIKPLFYVLMLGVSVTEFLSYMKRIRNGTEPRPFSQYPIIVPFAASIEFTYTEVEESMELLEKANILEPIIYTTNKKDSRMRIADKRLINLIQQLRIIASVYYYKIMMKVGFIDTPDEEEKEVMDYFYGEKRASHFLVFLNARRKEYLKTVTKRKLQERKRSIKNLTNYLESLVAACGKENEEIIKDELLRKLCLPFILSKEGLKGT
jgi:hypothetical protein